jgi:succinate--hydroxymethylglutarate CoA-transferase
MFLTLMNRLGIPVKFGDTPGSIRRQPPTLGEHTDSILQELGDSQETISQLRQEGVI